VEAAKGNSGVRKLILKMSISVDGFVAGPEGQIDWMFPSMEDAAAAWVVDVIGKAGAHLMGSRTFHDMAAYWPTSTEVFAAPMNDIPKVVFTRKGLTGPDPAGTTAALRDASAHIPVDPGAPARGGDSWAHPRIADGDLRDEIARLKTEPGRDLVAHGGAEFAVSLAAAGLIDEYVLLVHPVALGRGLALFADLPAPQPLALLESVRFARGAVAQVYRPA
jgi:dihydrofolate reductase